MEAAERHRVEVDLHDRLVGADPGVVRERHTEGDQQVALVHEPAGDRRTRASEHPARERMVVGDEARSVGLRERNKPPIKISGTAISTTLNSTRGFRFGLYQYNYNNRWFKFFNWP